MSNGTFWWLVVISFVLATLFYLAATDIGSLEDKVAALQTAVATTTP